MKKILLAIIFFAVSTGLFASPARPVAVKLMQPDGQIVEVFLRGDEKIRWMESPDGYTLLRNAVDAIVYAMLDPDGNLIPSDILYAEPALRSSSTASQIANIPKNLRFSSEQINQKMTLWNEKNQKMTQNTPARRSPFSGSALRAAKQEKAKAICVLMQFRDDDKKMTRSTDDFNLLMNQPGYSKGGEHGSVRDFYFENSYGQLDMDVTVVGPYTSEKMMDYYGRNDSQGWDSDPWALAEEAARAAFGTAGVNPADFDNDGDGYIDAMHVIYAGYGEEGGGAANTIWAHEAWFSRDLIFNDHNTGATVRLSNYSCSPELNGNSGTNITHIGVICHEFGHIFGSPDYYDIDGDASGGEFKGTGRWDLMSTGSWNGPNQNGSCPAHINMYQKIQNGWVEPIWLDTDQTQKQYSNIPNSAQNAIVYVLPSSDSDVEFYIIENRQKIGFDYYVPGHGLLIYHANLNDRDYYWNEVNMGYPQKMYPVCASSNVAIPNSSVASYGEINTAGCPFPGTSGKTDFTNLSTPQLTGISGIGGGLINITDLDGLVSFSTAFYDTSIKQVDAASQFAVYPNPVRQGGTVTVKSDFSGFMPRLAVYNLAGMKISETTLSGSASEWRPDLPKGAYLLRLTDGLRTATSKIAVE
jgi:M6 family metalloprotease-like protein